MPRLVNENLPKPPRRARYLLISLGIHAAVIFTFLGLQGGEWLTSELIPSKQVAILFSQSQPQAPAPEQTAPAEAPEPAAPEPTPDAPTKTAKAPAPTAAPASQVATGESGESAAASPAQLVNGAGRTGTPSPPYPRWARERGWEGRIVLELEILPSGRVGEVTVLESTGHDKLDDHTVAWAKESLRFEPATLAGVPVATSYKLALRYDLRERG